MASQTKFPTATSEEVASGGYLSWSNVSHIVSQNNDGALVSNPATFDSNWLCGSAFGFSIPAGRIDGARIDVRLRSVSADPFAGTGSLSFALGFNPSALDAGTAVFHGVEYRANTNTQFITYSYGSQAYLWNSVLTPAIVNASTFRVGVIVSYPFAAGANVEVDAVSVTVFYTPRSAFFAGGAL